MSNFNPQEHMQDIKGKPYLPVQWRLVWVREEHPEWTILTEIVKLEEKMAIVRATIADGNNRVLANAHKMETQSGFFDFLEKAETGAIGRALAMCGYGTQFSPDLDEQDRIVDSPVNLGASSTSKGSTTPLKKENATQGSFEPKTEEMASQQSPKASKVQINALIKAGVAKGLGEIEMQDMLKRKFNLESYLDITKEQIDIALKGISKMSNKKSEDINPDELPEDLFDGRVEE